MDLFHKITGARKQMKLTPAQKLLLRELPTTCADFYPPAKKLVELDLARWEEGRFADTLVATEAGEELIKKLSDAGDYA